MTVEVPPQIAVYVKKTDDFMAKYPSFTQYEKLKELEEKTGYSKVYFFAAASVLVAVLLFVLGGVKLLSDLLTFVYPAYMSFKAIDSSSSSTTGTEKAGTSLTQQWLTYWIVFALFATLENIMSFIVTYIPFYYVLKSCIFVYLYHPKFHGASVVYGVVRPIILPYMEQLEAAGTTEKKAE